MAGAREGAHDRPWVRPLFHSLILLPLSLLLGVWAHERAQVEAVRIHEETHRPPLPVWRTLLSANGFVEFASGEEDREGRRRLRLLRASGAPEGLVWITSDVRWIAIMDPEGVPRLFERNDACRAKRLAEIRPPKSGKGMKTRRVAALPELRIHSGPGKVRSNEASTPWEDMGRGWTALEAALARVSGKRESGAFCGGPIPSPGHAQGGRFSSISSRDPREIRF